MREMPSQVSTCVVPIVRPTPHALVPAGLPAMSGCVALTYIDLDDNKQLTAAGLEPFCASSPPKLATLSLQRCDLDGELACHVVPVLHLTNFCITDAEKARVKAALPHLPTQGVRWGKGLYL